MKSSLYVFLLTLLVLAGSVTAQERFESGPYKGFVKEQPELNTVEIPKPFKVSLVRGRIDYSGGEKLPGAYFEIRDKSGRVRTAITDENGQFALAGVPRGKYDFRVSKNQFKPFVGTVIVSRRWWKSKPISILIQLGD